MPAPYTWLPLPDVLAHLGVAPGSAQEPLVEAARVAAADEVEHLRPDLLDTTSGTYGATPRVVQGAVLWAARLYARRGSPAGVVSFGEYGQATAPSFDADAERLLGIGRYASPVVG